MSAALKEAAINEALELSYAFRQNAALRNGLPDCKRIPFGGLEDEPPPKQEPPIVNVTAQMPAAPAATVQPSPGETANAVEGSFLRRVAPWVIAAATGGFGVPLLWSLTQHEPAKPPISSEAITQPAPDDGSLLQYLQDHGFHRPEGAWPTK